MATQVQPATETIRSLNVRSDIGQSLLAIAYLTMETQGLLSMVFWQKTPKLMAFLEWCDRPDCIVVGCFVETVSPTLERKVELAGLGWVENIKERNGFRYGDVGEVFWRETQAAGHTTHFGRALLDFAFNECRMHTVYGVTPERNIAAVRFMRHVGFESFGPVPNLCCWNGVECGGYLSAMTKVAWLKRKSKEAA